MWADIEGLKDSYRKIPSDRLREILSSPYPSRENRRVAVVVKEVLRERGEKLK